MRPLVCQYYTIPGDNPRLATMYDAIQENWSTAIIQENSLPLVKIASTLRIVLCSRVPGFKMSKKAILHLIVLKESPSLEGLPVELPVCFIHNLLVSLFSSTVLQNCLCPLFRQPLKGIMLHSRGFRQMIGRQQDVLYIINGFIDTLKWPF